MGGFLRLVRQNVFGKRRPHADQSKEPSHVRQVYDRCRGAYRANPQLREHRAGNRRQRSDGQRMGFHPRKKRYRLYSQTFFFECPEPRYQEPKDLFPRHGTMLLSDKMAHARNLKKRRDGGTYFRDFRYQRNIKIVRQRGVGLRFRRILL